MSRYLFTEEFFHDPSPISIWTRMIKLPISLMASASAFAGYTICDSHFSGTSIMASLSVFVLAAGSAALNNYQDREMDCFFSRTNQRPLPKKLISHSQALYFALTLISIGLTGLLLSPFPLSTVLAGLFAVLLYNGIYTPLKKMTVLAIIPGTLCGMMPPLIGWTAAGGSIKSPEIWILMTILGLWQLPHFWLLLLANRKEYRQSHFPNMLSMFKERQLKSILYVWITAYATMALLLPLTTILKSDWTKWLLVISAALLILIFTRSLFKNNESLKYSGKDSDIYSRLFRRLNVSMAFILFLIIIDQI